MSVKTATIPVWRLWSPTRARLTARLPDFVTLMKPRVMVLHENMMPPDQLMNLHMQH